MEPKPNSEEKKSEKGKPPPLRPIFFHILCTFKCAYDAAAAKYKRNNSDNPSDAHLTAVWTARLGKFTITLAVIGFCTLVVFYCQLRVSQDSEQRQLRAYVGEAPSGGVVHYVGNEQKYGISVRIINSGLTPAYNVSTGISVHVHRYPYGDASILKDFPVPVTRNSQTLFPQGYVDLNGWSDQKVSMDDFLKLFADKKSRIYGFGVIAYDDAFGNPHVTKFCSSFYLATKTVEIGAPQAGGALGERCWRDNDSD